MRLGGYRDPQYTKAGRVIFKNCLFGVSKQIAGFTGRRPSGPSPRPRPAASHGHLERTARTGAARARVGCTTCRTEGYSRGTQGVLKRYSRGIQKVLQGYSRGTQGVLEGCSRCGCGCTGACANARVRLCQRHVRACFLLCACCFVRAHEMDGVRCRLAGAACAASSAVVASPLAMRLENRSKSASSRSLDACGRIIRTAKKH
jgi:hypothetical protein